MVERRGLRTARYPLLRVQPMYDDELNRFKRDINLVDFAERCYGYERVRRESSRASASLRHPVNDDKVIVARDQGGHWIYFSVRDDRDHGTIIDFVHHRENRSLGEVRKQLRDYLGTPPPDRAPRERAPDLKPIERDRAAVERTWAAASSVNNSLYLNERALRPETLTDPKFVGTWKQDARGNLLFVHRDEDGISGYEIKNRGFTGFATGGTKRLWHSVPGQLDTVLVVAESAIDALSYHQLHGEGAVRTRYASLAGAPSQPQLELVARVLAAMPAKSTLIAAIDGDEGGRKIAEHLAAVAAKRPGVAFQRDSPDLSLGKDWNDALQRLERDFVRLLPPSLGRRVEAISRSR
jgi:hypothetical protein